MTRLPKPWHAAYDWIDAAGELPLLVSLAGSALDDYARACVDNFADNPSGEGFIESDILGLHAHLRAHLNEYPSVSRQVAGG